MAPDSSWKSIFQSTPPRGRRRVHNCFLRSSQDISIHASAREATFVRGGEFGYAILFQSTPPRGRRRDRADQKLFRRISIHASAREATHRSRNHALPGCISIHASAREATIFTHILQGGRRISIHASAREATALITNFYI